MFSKGGRAYLEIKDQKLKEIMKTNKNDIYIHTSSDSTVRHVSKSPEYVHKKSTTLFPKISNGSNAYTH